MKYLKVIFCEVHKKFNTLIITNITNIILIQIISQNQQKHWTSWGWAVPSSASLSYIPICKGLDNELVFSYAASLVNSIRFVEVVYIFVMN